MQDVTRVPLARQYAGGRTRIAVMGSIETGEVLVKITTRVEDGGLAWSLPTGRHSEVDMTLTAEGFEELLRELITPAGLDATPLVLETARRFKTVIAAERREKEANERT